MAAQNRAISRRAFLRGAATTVIVVAAGGVYRAVDQGVFSPATGPAYAPWTTWRTDAAQGPLALVQAAILAASPHNSQPWLFRVSDTQIDLYADTGRHLGAMDPYLREMYIGLGCAVENMLLAAQALGYTAETTLAPGTLALAAAAAPTPVATLRLTSAPPQPSPLYDAIPQRHTNRAPYDLARALAPDVATQLRQQVGDPDVQLFLFAQGDGGHQRFVDETVAATEWIIADATMSHDSHAWFSTSWDEVQRDKDGPYIDTAGVPPLVRAMVKILPPLPQRFIDDGWLSGTRSGLDSAALVGLLAVRDLYDAPQALGAGRVWQRLHLWATTQGLAMQPMNQMPEVADRERQLAQSPRMARILDEVTGDPAWRPTFAFRLGQPSTTVLPSARRPVAEVVRS